MSYAEIYTSGDGARLDKEELRRDGYTPLEEKTPPRDTDLLLMTEDGFTVGFHDGITWLGWWNGEEIHEPTILAWKTLRHVNDYLYFTCQHDRCRQHVPASEALFSKGVGAVCERCWQELGCR